ncbi:hypothetical protein AAMO2058_001646500 [Amorphochlora amoebiformis]
MKKRAGFVKPVLDLSPEMEQKSYRVDAGEFQHGDLRITNEGVQSGNGDRTPSTRITYQDIKLLEKLGAGASGTVHRATYEGKEIAVKVIDIFVREKRHQLLKEIRSMSKMNSPFVASLIGAFFRDGAIFICIEYLDSGSLEDILKVSTFPIPAIRVATRQLIAGLVAMHGLRHMHRDIKPANICLNSKGEVKFTDFGIAREIKETVGVAKTFVGTCTYMSPERIQGNEYSYNSDIWSLGLTLLQCVVGRYPYSVNGVYIDLMQQIVQDPAPSFSKSEKDNTAPAGVRKLREDFRDFITKSLQKDPNKRFQAKTLQAHPFIKVKDEKMREGEKKKFASWISKVKKIKKAGKK